jgi:hypothetical protein
MPKQAGSISRVPQLVGVASKVKHRIKKPLTCINFIILPVIE